MKTSIIILSIFVGVFLTTSIFLGYSLYSMDKVVSQDHATLTQVVSFLQSASKQQTPNTVQK